MSKPPCRMGTRQSRAMIQSPTPKITLLAQPNAMAFKWAERIRPKVASGLFPSSSGLCSLKEANMPKTVPANSQSMENEIKKIPAVRMEESITLNAVRSS